jgi:hypothetical protein
MATKVDVLNGALVLMGQPPAAGPADTSTWVKRIVARYPSVVKTLLEKHPWKFARVMEQLQRLPTASGGYEYSFNRPAKCLKICFINNTGDDEDDEWHEYDVGDGKIHADYDTLYMWYISSDYLIKEGSWPQTFADAVSAELAFQCLPVSSRDRGARNDAKLHAKDVLKSAKSTDAAEKPFRRNPTGTWARSRRSGARYRTDG